MYELFGTFRSRTQRVIWALEEMELDYRLVDVLPHSQEVEKLSQYGKIPVLKVDERSITDSGAILNFLSDRHQKLGFPSGTIERALQDGHLLAAIDEVDGPLWVLSRAERSMGQELPQMRDMIAQILVKGFALLEKRIGEGPYLMAETFTVADIYLAHALAWARGYRFPMPEAVTAYYKRCYARPYAQKMREKYA